MTLFQRLINLAMALVVALIITYIGLWIVFRFFPGVLPKTWGKWLSWPRAR